MFRLRDVVDAGAAAAPGGFREFGEGEPGDEFEQLAGLGGDFLAVAKVAGFVISDGSFAAASPRGAATVFDKVFVDVLDLGIPVMGTGGIGRIIGKEVAVFFQVGAAATGVGDDGVEFPDGKEVQLAAGEGAGGFEVAIVGVQGAATGLDGRREDLAAIGEEDIGGVAIDVRKCQVLDTTGEKGDTAVRRSLGREGVGFAWFFILAWWRLCGCAGADGKSALHFGDEFMRKPGRDSRGLRLKSTQGWGKKTQES